MAPTLPCRFYAVGNCSNGSNCTFIHEKSTVCPFYLQGNCRFGNYCEMKHEKQREPVKNIKFVVRPSTPSTKSKLDSLPKKSIDSFNNLTLDSVNRNVKTFESLATTCPFGLKGICRNKNCQYTHGLLCENCNKQCIDPKNVSEHSSNCKNNQQKTQECVVCMENVFL